MPDDDHCFFVKKFLCIVKRQDIKSLFDKNIPDNSSQSLLPASIEYLQGDFIMWNWFGILFCFIR